MINDKLGTSLACLKGGADWRLTCMLFLLVSLVSSFSVLICLKLHCIPWFNDAVQHLNDSFPPKKKKKVIFYSPSCHFKLWDTKTKMLCIVLVALHHAVIMNEDWRFQDSKRMQESITMFVHMTTVLFSKSYNSEYQRITN